MRLKGCVLLRVLASTSGLCGLALVASETATALAEGLGIMVHAESIPRRAQLWICSIYLFIYLILAKQLGVS